MITIHQDKLSGEKRCGEVYTTKDYKRREIMEITLRKEDAEKLNLYRGNVINEKYYHTCDQFDIQQFYHYLHSSLLTFVE